MRWKIALAYIILTGLTLFWILPYYVAVATSFKTLKEVTEARYLEPPTTLYIDAYIKALKEEGRGLLNSLIVSLPATFLSVLIGSLGGYFLARFRFRGAQLIFFLVAVATFIPYQILLVPLVQVMGALGLMNTYAGLIVTYTVLFAPWAALISSAFFMAIPKELEEAAMLDGAGPLRTFFMIVLPVAAPGIVSTTIIVFTSVWNDFLFALTLSMSPEIRPVQPTLAALKGSFVAEWNTQMAGAVLASLPPLVIFLLLGRYFIKGLLAGALKT